MDETGSTNADMLALAAGGAPEGLWLRAERQTAGRGRQGRKWVSPPGNLYASGLVRLRPGDPLAPGLALVAGVALWQTVAGLLSDTISTSLALKWPNDLLLHHAKLAGVLLERADDAVVVGVGVNLAHHPTDLDRPVTSLVVSGVEIAPEPFLIDLAMLFADRLAFWRGNGLSAVCEVWLDRAHKIGTPLSVKLPSVGTVSGTFDGLDPTGALLLRLASGEQRVIHAGDVFLI